MRWPRSPVPDASGRQWTAIPCAGLGEGRPGAETEVANGRRGGDPVAGHGAPEDRGQAEEQAGGAESGGQFALDGDMDPEQQLALAVLDDGYVPAAEPGATAVVPHVNADTMAMPWCSGRFVGSWYDGRSSGVVQVAPDGAVLARPTTFGDMFEYGRGRIVCVPGGAVILEYERLTTLRWPGA